MNKTTTQGPRRLARAQIDQLLELVRYVDSVELKATVPTEGHRATIAGLPLDPVESEPRQVFFFDTPDLALNRAGVVVRARRMQGGGADTVVKLRPVVPAELPDELRHSGSFKVEVDVMPGGFVCSGSLKGKADGDEVRACRDRRFQPPGALLPHRKRDRPQWCAGDEDQDGARILFGTTEAGRWSRPAA